jgi:hypothetical protein
MPPFPTASSALKTARNTEEGPDEDEGDIQMKYSCD